MPYITDIEYLELLEQRVRNWKEDESEINLFMKMYQGMMDSGCFEDGDRTIMEIVDNDVINWCTIIYEDDDIFNKLIEAYNNGEYEVDGYCIEVVDDLNNPTMILARC